MILKASLVAIVLATALVAETGAAQSPALIPVRGTLVDDEGNAVDGKHLLTFDIFDNADGKGVALYNERHADVDVRAGFFEAYLGDGTARTRSISRCSRRRARCGCA